MSFTNLVGLDSAYWSNKRKEREEEKKLMMCSRRALLLLGSVFLFRYEWLSPVYERAQNLSAQMWEQISTIDKTPTMGIWIRHLGSERPRGEESQLLITHKGIESDSIPNRFIISINEELNASSVELI